MSDEKVKEVKREKTQQDVNETVKKLNGNFKTQLTHVLNANGIDSQIGIADWILADYLVFALMNFEHILLKKEINEKGFPK